MHMYLYTLRMYKFFQDGNRSLVKIRVSCEAVFFGHVRSRRGEHKFALKSTFVRRTNCATLGSHIGTNA